MDHTADDTATVHAVIERFSALMVTSGVGRMPARVYAALMVSENGRLTAGDLAATLQISPAAVSGAVRYLIGVGMVERHRPIGTRRDEYALAGDNWYEVFMNREPLLQMWSDVTREGSVALGEDTPAGRRMAETAEFFAFMLAELDGVLARWQQRRTESD